MDGLNWDLMNDGLGNPKNTRNMLQVHEGGPAMSLGVRENAEAAVRAGITHILFAVRPEDERQGDGRVPEVAPAGAQPVPGGRQAQPGGRTRQESLLRPRGGLRDCHPEPLYTDKRSHDVGSAGKYDKPTDKFNTPRLDGDWRTAPYMHDGQYLTIKELIVRGKHGAKGGNLESLSEQQIDDLVEYVLSL